MSTKIIETVENYLNDSWSEETEQEMKEAGKTFFYESLGQLGEYEEIPESEIELLMREPDEIEDQKKWRRYLQAGKALSQKVSGYLVRNLPILGEWIQIDETYGNNKGMDKKINWESIPYRSGDDIPEVRAGDFEVKFDSERYEFEDPLEKFVKFTSSPGYPYSEIADKFMEFGPEVKIPIKSLDSVTLGMKDLEDLSDAQMTAAEHATKRTKVKDTTEGYSKSTIDFEGGELTIFPHSVKLKADSYSEELEKILNLLEIS